MPSDVLIPPGVPHLSYRVRAINGLIRFFPTKLIPPALSSVREKVASHPMLIARPISALDNFVPPDGITVSILPSSCYGQLAAHDEGLAIDVYQQRAAAGDVCLALYADEVLVCYQWFSFQRAGIFLGFDKEIVFRKLTERQAYCYDFYTYKKYRGHGYGTLLKAFLFSYLTSKAVTELLTCVHQTNDASLAVQLKYGFHPVEMVYCYRLLSWSFAITASQRENRQLFSWFREYERYLQERRTK